MQRNAHALFRDAAIQVEGKKDELWIWLRVSKKLMVRAFQKQKTKLVKQKTENS